jgi:uncharacterized membrane protein YvlD (DUF360 family)
MNEKIQKVAGLVATGKFWKEVIIMTLGMMVAAAAVYYFLVPSKLIIGTVSGLSIVLSGIFETFFGIQIKVSLFVVIINAILLVLAWLLIGEEFGAKTVYTAMILGPLMDFWAWVMPYQCLVYNIQEILKREPEPESTFDVLGRHVRPVGDAAGIPAAGAASATENPRPALSGADRIDLGVF